MVPRWEMAGADGLQLRARLEELYETNNILHERNLLLAPQLDLDDQDGYNRIHHTDTHDKLARKLFAGTNVNTCPRDARAVRHLTK